MGDVFIARQPIFDRNMDVFAYELLFRNSGESFAANITDGDRATSTVILNTFIDIGIENLVGSRAAFINLTRLFISNPDLMLAPHNQLVLEVLEDIEPNEVILDTLRTLKDKGHTIALDDFVYHNKFEPYIDLADIVKLDVMTEDREALIQHAERLKPRGIRLLAEKVETHDEFEFLKALDFDYFQGYFFARPAIVQGREISSNQLAVLELVAKIANPDVEVDELSQIISSDVSLSHKLLKFVNSPLSGLRTEVDSIRQAVVLIGLRTIKNWVTLLALSTGSDKPVQLTNTALVRARCSEMLGKTGQQEHIESYFTVGLFSALDALMDQPLDRLLAELPLSDAVLSALLRQQGVLGDALKCTLAMEHGQVEGIAFGSLDQAQIFDIYIEAIQWADTLIPGAADHHS
jgi:EAL and modified HD-GYP domain-containing signal transduction protein